MDIFFINILMEHNNLNYHQIQFFNPNLNLVFNLFSANDKDTILHSQN